MTSPQLSDKELLALETAIATSDFGNRFAEDEKRSVRSPHTGRIIKSPDYGSDEFLNISFSTEEVFSKRDTYLANGKPSYVAMDFITISSPNDKNTIIHRPITDFDQWRFPFEYEAFKKGENAAMRGVSIEQWSELNKEQVKELKHNGVHTVEQLASLSDSHAGTLRVFFALKAKAQNYLDQHRKSDDTKVLEAKLAERDVQMAEMQKKLDALLSMMTEKGKKT